MTKKWSSRLTFFAFVVLMVGLGSNDSLRGIFPRSSKSISP